MFGLFGFFAFSSIVFQESFALVEPKDIKLYKTKLVGDSFEKDITDLTIERVSPSGNILRPQDYYIQYNRNEPMLLHVLLTLKDGVDWTESSFTEEKILFASPSNQLARTLSVEKLKLVFRDDGSKQEGSLSIELDL